jgi:hypothetical protein
MRRYPRRAPFVVTGIDNNEYTMPINPASAISKPAIVLFGGKTSTPSAPYIKCFFPDGQASLQDLPSSWFFRLLSFPWLWRVFISALALGLFILK